MQMEVQKQLHEQLEVQSYIPFPKVFCMAMLGCYALKFKQPYLNLKAKQ